MTWARVDAILGRRVSMRALAVLRAAAERSAEPAAAAALKLAAQRYVDAAAALTVDLLRHLHDEENLVVPLLIERGAY